MNPRKWPMLKAFPGGLLLISAQAAVVILPCPPDLHVPGCPGQGFRSHPVNGSGGVVAELVP
ncbi:hypothetical protein [Rhodovulum steppense]|nr:hypothetical protein [Rhodovulum steppense]